MIYDCFLFFNEAELLELRLKIMDDVVDKFVIVESDKTFTGNDKDFIFDLSRYEEYKDKIIYIQVTDSPKKNGVWNIEEFQRNCILRGLTEAKEGDRIIISDLDEIPCPRLILKHKNNPNPVTFVQSLYYYYVNCLSDKKWNGSIMYPYGYEGLSPQDFRVLARRGLNKVKGGWHYTFLGGIDMVKHKLSNLSDAHLVADKIGSDEELTRKYDDNKVLWDESIKTTILTEDELPKHIKDFIRKYPHVFYRSAN